MLSCWDCVVISAGFSVFCTVVLGQFLCHGQMLFFEKCCAIKVARVEWLDKQWTSEPRVCRVIDKANASSAISCASVSASLATSSAFVSVDWAAGIHSVKQRRRLGVFVMRRIRAWVLPMLTNVSSKAATFPIVLVRIWGNVQLTLDLLESYIGL